MYMIRQLYTTISYDKMIDIFKSIGYIYISDERGYAIISNDENYNLGCSITMRTIGNKIILDFNHISDSECNRVITVFNKFYRKLKIDKLLNDTCSK